MGTGGCKVRVQRFSTCATEPNAEFSIEKQIFPAVAGIRPMAAGRKNSSFWNSLRPGGHDWGRIALALDACCVASLQGNSKNLRSSTVSDKEH